MFDPHGPDLLGEVLQSYEGDTDDRGHPHGFGAAVFHSGNGYKGGWINGVMNGTGCVSFSNGVVYEGQIGNGVLSGFGRYLRPDGAYEGDLLDGLPHREGRLTSPGLEYEYKGEWKFGKRDGDGVLTTKRQQKATVYQGHWTNDMPHGYGEVVYPSGNKYEGEWQCGVKQGHGTMHWYDRSEEYSGEWMEDKPHGKGEYTWSVKSIDQFLYRQNKYKGSFVKGKREGNGVVEYADGSVYQGQFQDDQRHGLGIYLTDKTIQFGVVSFDRFVQSSSIDIPIVIERVYKNPIDVLQAIYNDGAVPDTIARSFKDFLSKATSCVA